MLLSGFKEAQTVQGIKEALKEFELTNVVEVKNDEQYCYELSTAEPSKLVEQMNGKQLLRLVNTKYK